jgi:hypothetical protein
MAAPHIPEDDNGQVLRQMYEGGDDLTQPRMVEFQHIFPTKERAIEFIAATTNETDYCELSWYAEEESWNVQVRRYMVPTHADITSLEESLAAIARGIGGREDGWGCMRIVSGAGDA